MYEMDLKNYTKLEQQRYNEIQKIRLALTKKQQRLQKQIEKLEQQQHILYKKLTDIERKVDKRTVRKCKHTNIYGPYECSRDDCSGGHHRCRTCGHQVDEASDEQFKKSGKKWIAWNEKY